MQNQTPIPQCAFDWYDEYAHGDISRRTFISRLSSLALTGLATASVLNGLTPNYAQAEQVSFNDPDITASYVEFESPQGHGQGRGYYVTPKSLTSKTPTVLVVHENRGLNPYIKDVARRLAKSGFIAFAPDALHSLGGYPGNDDQGRTMQRSMDRSKIEQDFIAAAKMLKHDEKGNGKVGVVGFCFGGYIANFLAAAIPDVINAAVPFYGSPAQDDLVANIKAPLMIQYAGLDTRINATREGYEQQLTAAKVNFVSHLYPDVNHGFHNDSTSRYDEAAANLAWQRTLEFFAEHLATA